MRISELWRYPVKSMGGEPAAALVVERRGAVADRLWAVVDADGKLGSGKNSSRFRRMDGLLECRVRLVGDTVEVTLPDGQQVWAGDPEADEAVRRLLHRDDVRLARESSVMHHDAAPLHVVTDASVRAVADQVDDVVDVRRFRPNVVVATRLPAGFVENDWVGRRASIGEVVVELTKRTERCVMVNAAQRGLEASNQVLKQITAANDLGLGVYGTVVEPGVVRRGDTLRLH